MSHIISIPHICHFIYTGRIFLYRLLHPKIMKNTPNKSKECIFLRSISREKKSHTDIFLHSDKYQVAAPPRSHHPAPQIAFFIAPQDPYVSAATLSPCWQAFINAEMIKYWKNWKLKPSDPVMNASLKSCDTQYASSKSWQNKFLHHIFRTDSNENV